MSRVLRHRRASVAALAVALGAVAVWGGPLFALLLPGLVMVLLLVVLVRLLVAWPNDPDAGHRIMTWTMLAFFLHLAIGLAVTNINMLRAFMGPDSLTYHAGALGILRHWDLGYPLPFLPSGKEGFYYMLAGVYSVVGPHAAAGLALNAGLSAAVVPVTSELTHRLFGPRAARFAAPIVVLLPGMLIWTSQLLREAGVVFLLVVTASFAVRLAERFTAPRVLGLSAALALLFTFRGYIALVVAGTLVLGVSLGRKQLLAGVGSSVGTLALLAVMVFSLGLGYSGYKIAIDSSNLKEVNTVHRDLALSANSGYGQDVDLSTTRLALSYLPVGLGIVAFGPLPWQLRGLSQMPGIIDVLAWWFLLPALWRGLGMARRNHDRRVAVLIFPAVGIALVLALAIGNFGTLVRERLQMIVLLTPIIAAGFASAAAHRAPVPVTAASVRRAADRG